MDGFIGFRGSKPIGNEVSIINLALFQFFGFLAKKIYITYENGQKSNFPWVYFFYLLIPLMGHHNAPKKCYGAKFGEGASRPPADPGLYIIRGVCKIPYFWIFTELADILVIWVLGTQLITSLLNSHSKTPLDGDISGFAQGCHSFKKSVPKNSGNYIHYDFKNLSLGI